MTTEASVNRGNKAKVSQPLISRLERAPFCVTIFNTITMTSITSWHISSVINAPFCSVTSEMPSALIIFWRISKANISRDITMPIYTAFAPARRAARRVSMLPAGASISVGFIKCCRWAAWAWPYSQAGLSWIWAPLSPSVQRRARCVFCQPRQRPP